MDIRSEERTAVTDIGRYKSMEINRWVLFTPSDFNPH